MMSGDAAAPNQILARAHQRVEKIVAKTFHKSYHRLRSHYDTASIVSETYMRLRSALESVQASAASRDAPMNVADFFRLVASKTHQVCIDLVRKAQVRMKAVVVPAAKPGEESMVGVEQMAVSDETDTSLLALWGEFHESVNKLPDEQKEVFQMCFYLDMKRAEVAQVLGLHPKEASRRWLAATEALKDTLASLQGS
jgi:RNA polymerase sigma-70 factor (ECF subfamily)